MRIFRCWPLLVICALASQTALALDVRFCTSFGTVDVELDERAAPGHVSGFLRYVDSGFYDGTVLHRIIPGVVVEGGRFDLAYQRREPADGVAIASNNGLSNLRGTIAAMRSNDPDYSGSRFIFNLADNTQFDARFGTPGNTVFGQVTSGLETLDLIADLPSQRIGNLDGVPVAPVEIRYVTVLDRIPLPAALPEADRAGLSSRLDLARARGDASGTLAAYDAMKRVCAGLNPAQRIAVAEAAITLGRQDLARYTLESFLADANALDPQRAAAERLYARLPASERSRNVDDLIAHCRRPAAPSVPNGRFTELATLQALEGNILRFRQLGQLYLTCIRQVIDRTELDETETYGITKRHNEMVVELTAVATRFNQAVRNLQSRQQSGLDPN